MYAVSAVVRVAVALNANMVMSKKDKKKEVAVAKAGIITSAKVARRIFMADSSVYEDFTTLYLVGAIVGGLFVKCFLGTLPPPDRTSKEEAGQSTGGLSGKKPKPKVIPGEGFSCFL